MTRTTVFQMNSIPKVQIRGGTGCGVSGNLLARRRRQYHCGKLIRFPIKEEEGRLS